MIHIRFYFVKLSKRLDDYGVKAVCKVVVPKDQAATTAMRSTCPECVRVHWKRLREKFLELDAHLKNLDEAKRLKDDSA